jgi:ankyrin repeat protein
VQSLPVLAVFHLHCMAARASTVEFWRAVYGGKWSAIKSALDSGCDIDTRDETAGTALIRLAGWGCTGIIEHLLEAGADTSIVNYHGMDALQRAAIDGHLLIVDCLLNAGATVQAETSACRLVMAASSQRLNAFSKVGRTLIATLVTHRLCTLLPYLNRGRYAVYWLLVCVCTPLSCDSCRYTSKMCHF